MLVRIKDYKVFYNTLHGDVQAADGINLEIGEGEIVGIAGESGCGKSTLCNSLILLKKPMLHVSGQVFIGDEQLPVSDYEAMKKFRYSTVSIIPQYAMDAMNPIKKIGRIIADLLGCHGKKYSDLEDEIKERMEMVDLPEKVLTMYPIELSGGMKQRMVMVISTLLNPAVLICDEVTSALDVSTQKAVVKMIRKFRDKGIVKSILFVTHDISVLYQLADSIIVMYAGKVVEKAPASVILKKPLHPYTKALISALPDSGVRYEEKKLSGIPGKPPFLINPPQGCRFKDRCLDADKKCSEEPEFLKVQENHLVACWKCSHQ